MKIVFLGAYFNHHQKPLSDALNELCDYSYIATTEMPEMRKALGYDPSLKQQYVCDYKTEQKKAKALIEEADVILTGSAPEELVRKCIKSGKPVFRYSERPLKKGAEPLKYFPRLVKWHLMNPANKPIYMLCASAYTAPDYSKFGLFKNKAFKWGYFPELKEYDENVLMVNKNKNSVLWAGRFLDWKHADDAINAAARLKNEGVDFKFSIIGNGPKEEEIRELIRETGLENNVDLLGSMKPEEVREHMEKSEIFVFTSDRNEGWGAVVNESMNSGCCIIASSAAGATPYLIEDGKNGFVYHYGNVDEFYEKLKSALLNREMREEIGRMAYRTIKETWNAKVAAKRFVCMAEKALAGKKLNGTFEEGPCSDAKNSWKD